MAKSDSLQSAFPKSRADFVRQLRRAVGLLQSSAGQMSATYPADSAAQQALLAWRDRMGEALALWEDGTLDRAGTRGPLFTAPEPMLLALIECVIATDASFPEGGNASLKGGILPALVQVLESHPHPLWAQRPPPDGRLLAIHITTGWLLPSNPDWSTDPGDAQAVLPALAEDLILSGPSPGAVVVRRALQALDDTGAELPGARLVLARLGSGVDGIPAEQGGKTTERPRTTAQPIRVTPETPPSTVPDPVDVLARGIKLVLRLFS